MSERMNDRLHTYIDHTVPTPEERAILFRRHLLWIGIRESKKKKLLHEKNMIEYKCQLNDREVTLTNQEQKRLLSEIEFVEDQIVQWTLMVEEGIKWLREFEKEHDLPGTDSDFL